MKPLLLLLLVSVVASLSAADRPRTVVSIESEKFLLNGKPTYAGRVWDGVSIDGRLMNSRMVPGSLAPSPIRMKRAFPLGRS